MDRVSCGLPWSMGDEEANRWSARDARATRGEGVRNRLYGQAGHG
jgi:hypothetical protein